MQGQVINGDTAINLVAHVSFSGDLLLFCNPAYFDQHLDVMISFSFFSFVWFGIHI